MPNRFIDQPMPLPLMRKPMTDDQKRTNMTKNGNHSDHNRDSAISSNSPRLSSGGEENFSSSPSTSKNCSILKKKIFGEKKCALDYPVVDHTYMNIVGEDGQILFVESNNQQNRDLSHTYENLSKFLLCSNFAENTARFDKLSLSDFSTTYSDRSQKMALTRSFSSL
uniref:Uncharacterized protein n=1 Tax=Romanomermis culicivorax TaxID=13658 RepID=A0A915I3B8_ROMCU